MLNSIYPYYIQYVLINLIKINNDLYSKNIYFRLLSICTKFPGFDSRLNQIQGVHLKFIAIFICMGIRLNRTLIFFLY